MKKVLLLLLMLPAMLLAAPIDPNLAQQVAENFINAPETGANSAIRKAPRKPKRMMRAPKQITNDQQFYVFNSEDGEGFVIVAADNVARPILSYSKTGTFDMENIPANKMGWLSMYNDEIKYAQSNNLQASEETQQAWAEVLENRHVAAEVVVAPLLTTTWAQSPYYNKYCPTITVFNWNTLSYVSAKAPTGCAATALAQVMKYWNWPVQGKGAHVNNSSKNAGDLYANFGAEKYDWDYMPDSLTPQSTQQEIEAVATLMYHCGIAMDMVYGFSSSGIKSLTQVENAVKKYFRYSSSTSTIKWEDYSAVQWIAQLQNQLNLGRPMVYTGMSLNKKSGHAFVCDGYSSDGAFHFNWGWGCAEQEEYYFLTALTPRGNGTGAGEHNYTYYQSALVGMVPDSGATATPNLQMNSNLSLSQNSITYGGSVVLTATIKNVGNAPFTGDISAMVVDTAGNYVTDFTIKNNYTIGISNTANISYTISNNALIVPGQYIIMLGSNCPETGLVMLGSNSYLPVNGLQVTYSAPIEKKSAFEIYSDCNNELTTGHQIWFRVTFGNTSSSTFTGRIALALYDPETLQLAQLVSEISFALTGIGAHEERTVNFIDTIRLEPKSYLAALVYSTDNSTYNFVGSTYSQNPCMVRVIKDPAEIDEETGEETEEFELKPGKYVIVASRAKEGDRNWYYMTSDLGTASTKRFQAVSTETESIDAIDITDLEEKFVWTLEADGSNWKLKNGTQYVTWTSGNSANLGITAKTMTFDVADNQVLAHFNDGTAERYLSLNATTNNNYFAFYSGTNQVEQLFFLPYDEGVTPPTPVRDCKSVPYTESFAASQGDFSVVNLTLPSGFTSIWNWDAQYGMVAKCIKGSTKYESEAWLISPCIELPADKTCTISFSHAAKFFQDTKQMSMWISADYDESAPDEAQWTRLVIPTYPTGNNWNWFNSGDINLSEYKGQNVNIAFCYKSNTNFSPQWEIKNFTVKEAISTALGNTIEHFSSATKILRNGQIYILRGDKIYTLTGQEAK